MTDTDYDNYGNVDDYVLEEAPVQEPVQQPAQEQAYQQPQQPAYTKEQAEEKIRELARDAIRQEFVNKFSPQQQAPVDPIEELRREINSIKSSGLDSVAEKYGYQNYDEAHLEMNYKYQKSIQPRLYDPNVSSQESKLIVDIADAYNVGNVRGAMALFDKYEKTYGDKKAQINQSVSVGNQSFGQPQQQATSGYPFSSYQEYMNARHSNDPVVLSKRQRAERAWFEDGSKTPYPIPNQTKRSN